ELIGKLLAAWVSYSLGGAGATAGLDRMPVALHGWSYAQTDPKLRATLQAGPRGFPGGGGAPVKPGPSPGGGGGHRPPRPPGPPSLAGGLGFGGPPPAARRRRPRAPRPRPGRALPPPAPQPVDARRRLATQPRPAHSPPGKRLAAPRTWRPGVPGRPAARDPAT